MRKGTITYCDDSLMSCPYLTKPDRTEPDPAEPNRTRTNLAQPDRVSRLKTGGMVPLSLKKPEFRHV